MDLSQSNEHKKNKTEPEIQQKTKTGGKSTKMKKLQFCAPDHKTESCD